MIVRARTVVTMAGTPIDNGAIAISDGRITAAGKFDEIKKSDAGRVLDLGEHIILPGLINAHCHLDYTLLRDRIPPKQSFSDWIRAINSEKEKLSRDDYLASIQKGLTEAARFGTTSIVNFEAFPELAVQARSPQRVWWLGELIDIRAPQSAAELASAAIGRLMQARYWGLAPHAPFTASKPLYQRCHRIGIRDNVVLSTHLAESGEEFEMFHDRSGPLFEFLESIGRDMADCGATTPLAWFLETVSSGSPNDLSHWIIIHLNELSEEDFALVRSIQPKLHVVHCPRSHDYFGHSEFAFERLRDLGCNICLATDSLASNENLNLFEEMQRFGQGHRGVPDREIVEMVTVNAARALNLQDRLGTIRPGNYGDLIAIPDSKGSDVFETIVAHSGAVSWGMLNGTAIQ
jgi:cytosine/adenosine deaminase-related metal-dependent hydrolase